MDAEKIDFDSISLADSPDRSHSRYPQLVVLVLACLAIFLATVFLYSRQNNFSSFYQPDEFEKARQLVTHDGLYLHPQLLLEGTALGLAVSRQQPTADLAGVRQVMLTGRWVSAMFAALAVTAFALIGYCYGGFVGFFLTALSLGLCPSILLNAHYMKEDTALLLGVGMTFLATFLYHKEALPTVAFSSLLFIGAAAGLAASGKYIGIVVLIAVLAFISFPWNRSNTLRQWGIVLAAFVITAVLINYSVFFNWSAFKAGLGYEVNHALKEHFGGTVMDRPNSFAIEALFRETMPHVLVLAGAFLVALGVFWKTTTGWDLFLVLFALGFALLLSFSIIPLYRYNLPIIALLQLMAALVISKAVIFAKRPVNWIVFATAIALIGTFQTRRCLNYLGQFANDSHVRLRSFIAHNVPPGSAVVADGYALQAYDDDPRLPDSEHTLPVKLEASFWAADVGNLDTLRALGVDYVAVAETSYGRFFDPHARPAPDDARYLARRQFYEQLFARGELVWSSDPTPPTHSFVNPSLRLYRVSALP